MNDPYSVPFIWHVHYYYFFPFNSPWTQHVSLVNHHATTVPRLQQKHANLRHAHLWLVIANFWSWDCGKMPYFHFLLSTAFMKFSIFWLKVTHESDTRRFTCCVRNVFKTLNFMISHFFRSPLIYHVYFLDKIMPKKVHPLKLPYLMCVLWGVFLRGKFTISASRRRCSRPVY